MGYSDNLLVSLKLLDHRMGLFEQTLGQTVCGCVRDEVSFFYNSLFKPDLN